MNGGLLGGGVRRVDDNRPLGATAVFAAGLVPLAAAIPGVGHAQMQIRFRAGKCPRTVKTSLINWRLLP